MSLSSGGAWMAMLGYTFQLYFDFCGYSDMAVGLGLMFGLRIP
jgi:alginate O-acetyltransferase complex protein AlgI